MSGPEAANPIRARELERARFPANTRPWKFSGVIRCQLVLFQMLEIGIKNKTTRYPINIDRYSDLREMTMKPKVAIKKMTIAWARRESFGSVVLAARTLPKIDMQEPSE